MQRVSGKLARPRKLGKSQLGFTLLELMAVVVIIGILSAVAVPSFQRFIIKSRESEAPTNLSAIARGARTYYNDEHLNKATGVIYPPQFAPMASSTNKQNGYATMPVPSPCDEIPGSPKYLANPARWHANHKVEPWTNLKFAIATSHFFQYRYLAASSGRNATYTAQAVANMDCDSKNSTFMFSGSVDSATGEIITNDIFVINQGE